MTAADISFSVVIPTYNRSALCYRAVQSVLAQTHPFFECIVVDDFSTDDTLERIGSITDPRVSIYRLDKNSGGSSVPVNTGSRKAKYAFVAFLDADDTWKPERLEEAAKQIAAAPVTDGLFYCTSIIRYEHGLSRIVPAQTDGKIYPEIKFNNIVGIASRVIVRKDIFWEAGGFDEGRYMDNDWECWIRVCALTNVCSLLTPLVIYTENADSISSDAAKVINGRFKFLRFLHGDEFCERHKDRFNIQLSKLLLSRGNSKAAREILQTNHSKPLSLYFYIAITYVPRSVLLFIYAVLSYLKFYLAVLAKKNNQALKTTA